MNIRFALPAEQARLEEINTVAAAAHWSRQQWLEVFTVETPRRLAWVAEEDDGTVGFLVALATSADWELENIAVLPESQRQGAGQALLAELVAQARTERAERILLEVRASNEAALRLYQRCGFKQIGRRAQYYRNPTEDALVMVLILQN